MKKTRLFLVLILILCFSFDCSPIVHAENLKIEADVYAKGCILIEDNIDSIMYQKNINERFYPASTVKILTALVALEKGNIKSKVKVGKNVLNLPGDSQVAGIQPGDVLTLEQLLYGMLVYSGNDCALAIAEYIGKSESGFAKMMNRKAVSLGSKDSNFVNSHGYHNKNQYTTPYDLAVIAHAASKNPVFLKIINTPLYKAVYKNKNKKIITKYWRTTDKFLRSGSGFSLKGIIGTKTGYTSQSGYNLVAFTNHEGHKYISVMLNSGNNERFRDTVSVMQKAYTIRDTPSKHSGS